MKPISPFQPPAGAELPRTLREVYADTLGAAERELQAAQLAVRADDSNENRARYARALAEHDKLSSQFPFVAAGAGDTEV